MKEAIVTSLLFLAPEHAYLSTSECELGILTTWITAPLEYRVRKDSICGSFTP